MNRTEAIKLVNDELDYATRNYGKFTSPHEGWAVLFEEAEELKGEVFKHHSIRDMTKMAKEARQVAAMAVRFLMDLC